MTGFRSKQSYMYRDHAEYLTTVPKFVPRPTQFRLYEGNILQRGTPNNPLMFHDGRKAGIIQVVHDAGSGHPGFGYA